MYARYYIQGGKLRKPSLLLLLESVSPSAHVTSEFSRWMSHNVSNKFGKIWVLGDLVAVVSLELTATTSWLVPLELRKPVLWSRLAGRGDVMPLEGGMMVLVLTLGMTMGSVDIVSTPCYWGGGGIG